MGEITRALPNLLFYSPITIFESVPILTLDSNRKKNNNKNLYVCYKLITITVEICLVFVKKVEKNDFNLLSLILLSLTHKNLRFNPHPCVRV